MGLNAGDEGPDAGGGEPFDGALEGDQAGGIDSGNAGKVDDRREDVAVDQGDGFERPLSGAKEERARDVIADRQ